MELTVMTFNLRYNNASDGNHAWPFRSRLAAQTIAESGAGVIGVQEGLFPMLADLQTNLAGYEWIGLSRRGDIEGEFCAIFYKAGRLRVLESGTFWLSETPEQPFSKSWDSSLPRICTWARFQLRERPEMQWVAYNAHLDHIGKEARLKGALLIWRKMEQYRQAYGLPALLMGDMNAEPHEDTIRFLQGRETVGGERSGLRDAYDTLPGGPEAVGRTFHGFKGGTDGLPIDYIFATPEVAIEDVRIDRRVAEGLYPSDHYPVVSRVRFAKER